MFVCRSVFFQQSGELQKREFLEQIHLQHRLAADLELSGGQAGPMGVLEARPAKFLRSEAHWRKKKKAHIETSETLKICFCVHINNENGTR